MIIIKGINILYFILFIIYPYIINILYIKKYNKKLAWFIWIPIISNIVSIVMILELLKDLFKTLLRYIIIRYYKMKYKISDEILEERKKIDPYDEEYWDDDWESQLKINKLYLYLNKK